MRWLSLLLLLGTAAVAAVPANPQAGPIRSFQMPASDKLDSSPDVSLALKLGWDGGSPDPAWSPDGRRIAHYDGVCVTVRDLDGGVVKKLRPPPKSSTGCQSPRWSPDGKRIVTGHDFHDAGWLFDVGTGKAKKLSPRGHGIWGASFGTNDWIAARIHQTGSVLLKPGEAEPYALISDKAPQMTGYFPSIAPGGRYAARTIEGYRKGGDLEILAIDLSRPTLGKTGDPWPTLYEHGDYRAIVGKRVGKVTGPVVEYVWQPDGEGLVSVTAEWWSGYGDYGYGPGTLVHVDLRSGGVRNLGVKGRNPTISPDGRWVAYDDPQGIHLIGIDGRGGRRLHPRGVEPRWSPRGDRILYQDVEEGVASVLALR